jgi:protein-L-isoaspartate(D-aspartate) O-methyltransferase
MNIELARFNMIEQQIRPWDVLDPVVLSLLAVVRREDFVPPSYRALAFVDMEVPLLDGQKMLAPRVEARLLQEAKVQRHERVLEIGAGSGFMAALLGHRAQHVISMESRPELAAMARANLRRAGMTNVEIREGNGLEGLADESPFDVIVLSGAVAGVPQCFFDQLKPGGRLLAIEGQEPVMRAVLYLRESATAISKVKLFDTAAIELDGFGPPTHFRF